jgi:hypothetical protein
MPIYIVKRFIIHEVTRMLAAGAISGGSIFFLLARAGKRQDGNFILSLAF